MFGYPHKWKKALHKTVHAYSTMKRKEGLVCAVAETGLGSTVWREAPGTCGP